MTKRKFVLTIISLFFSLVALVLLFTNSPYFIYFALASILGTGLYGFFIRKENNELLRVSNILNEELDIDKYIIEYKKIKKNYLNTKDETLLDKLLILEAKTATMDTNELIEELEYYIDLEPKFSDVEKFVFYQSWFKYLLHQKQLEKASALLDQMNILYAHLPNNYRHLINNLRINKLRLNVFNNVYVTETEHILKQLLQSRLSKLNFISVMYLLGILSFNNNDLKTARLRFEYVITNGKTLAIVEEAQKYLNIIHSKQN